MAGRLVALASLAIKNANTAGKLACSRAYSSDIRGVIGKREIVGFGFNGQPNYVDRPDFPMTAVRWKEPTSDIKVRSSILLFVLL